MRKKIFHFSRILNKTTVFSHSFSRVRSIFSKIRKNSEISRFEKKCPFLHFPEFWRKWPNFLSLFPSVSACLAYQPVYLHILHNIPCQPCQLGWEGDVQLRQTDKPHTIYLWILHDPQHKKVDANRKTGLRYYICSRF